MSKRVITADHVLISGEVHGQIKVRQKIEIYPKGRVLGNIKTPCLMIKEGAVFEGNSRMGDDNFEKIHENNNDSQYLYRKPGCGG
jgi:cytoskeletal protein CcmA (bactofilin family)